MLVRNCAGGVVFHNNKVFLLKNEKGEWVFPKGVMKNGEHPNEVALKRLEEEAGITANIVTSVGGTSYEFFSVTRQKPVCNKIVWYIMTSFNENFKIGEEKFIEGGYFDIDEAINRITYSQDKSLLSLSYHKYKELA